MGQFVVVDWAAAAATAVLQSILYCRQTTWTSDELLFNSLKNLVYLTQNKLERQQNCLSRAKKEERRLIKEYTKSHISHQICCTEHFPLFLVDHQQPQITSVSIFVSRFSFFKIRRVSLLFPVTVFCFCFLFFYYSFEPKFLPILFSRKYFKCTKRKLQITQNSSDICF